MGESRDFRREANSTHYFVRPCVCPSVPPGMRVNLMCACRSSEHLFCADLKCVHSFALVQFYVNQIGNGKWWLIDLFYLFFFLQMALFLTDFVKVLCPGLNTISGC